MLTFSITISYGRWRAMSDRFACEQLRCRPPGLTRGLPFVSENVEQARHRQVDPFGAVFHLVLELVGGLFEDEELEQRDLFRARRSEPRRASGFIVCVEEGVDDLRLPMPAGVLDGLACVRPAGHEVEHGGGH